MEKSIWNNDVEWFESFKLFIKHKAGNLEKENLGLFFNKTNSQYTCHLGMITKAFILEDIGKNYIVKHNKIEKLIAHFYKKYSDECFLKILYLCNLDKYFMGEIKKGNNTIYNYVLHTNAKWYSKIIAKIAESPKDSNVGTLRDMIINVFLLDFFVIIPNQPYLSYRYLPFGKMITDIGMEFLDVNRFMEEENHIKARNKFLRSNFVGTQNNKSSNQKLQAKLLMFIVENALRDMDHKQTIPWEQFNTKNLTIEHIMPLKINQSLDWKKRLGSDYRNLHHKWVNTIGNITLLEKACNARLGNSNFAKKYRTFNQDNLFINKNSKLDYDKDSNSFDIEVINHRGVVIFDIIYDKIKNTLHDDKRFKKQNQSWIKEIFLESNYISRARQECERAIVVKFLKKGTKND